MKRVSFYKFLAPSQENYVIKVKFLNNKGKIECNSVIDHEIQ